MDIRQISFEELLKSRLNATASLDKDVIVSEHEQLSAEHVLNPAISSPVRLDAVVFILCKYGKITFSVDYKTYTLTKGSLLILTKYHVIDDVQVDNNCEVVVLTISRNFMTSVVRDLSSVRKMKKAVRSSSEPVLKLEDDEMRDLSETIERIKKYLKKSGHTFQSQLVRNEVSNFFMEFGHFFRTRMNVSDENTEKESRGEEITRQFVHLLIEHFKEQHEVAYYAGLLKMTTDNLSRSITASLGKSPIRCIADLLVAEAKILLHEPDATVKQVADELNFGDQSSFGKFFRKHTGMTPVEYKNGGMKHRKVS
jgi:AraC-like DNA-binding protein